MYRHLSHLSPSTFFIVRYAVPPSVRCFSTYPFHYSVRCTAGCPIFLCLYFSLSSTLYQVPPFAPSFSRYLFHYSVRCTTCSSFFRATFSFFSTAVYSVVWFTWYAQVSISSINKKARAGREKGTHLLCNQGLSSSSISFVPVLPV